LKGGRTDDDEDDDRSSDEDEVRVEKTRRLADATPARDASSPAGTSAPTSLRTPALFSRERSIQAYFSPRDSQW
jgi:hypothetical protein